MMSSKEITRKTRELLTVAIIDPPFPIFGHQATAAIPAAKSNKSN